MAKMLVDSMTKQFVDIEMKDHYQDALRAMIKAKIDGKEFVSVQEEETPVVDIMTALKASIEKAKKPMEKAKGKQAKEKKKAGKEVKAKRKAG
jgi:DNA end-binding protein Ku